MMHRDIKHLKKIEMFFSNNRYKHASTETISRIIQMSFSRKTASTSAVAKSTPFCKVCRDAGRPEKEYTSHYVKDQPGPNGKVVCPTLLNQACRICNKTGHTSTYCTEYRPRQEKETEKETEKIEKNDDWTPVERRTRRHVPYAHPHGPRVRLELESRALSYTTKTNADDTVNVLPAPVPAPRPEPTTATASVMTPNVVDIRKVDLQHAKKWSEEEPYLMTDYMFREATKALDNSLTTSEEFDFIMMCDDVNSISE